MYKGNTRDYVTEETFVSPKTLNGQLDKNDIIYGLRNAGPVNGFWLSLPEGNSCKDRDRLYRIMDVRPVAKFGVGRLIEWLNAKKVTYRLLPSAKLLNVKTPDILLKYKIPGPMEDESAKRKSAYSGSLKLIDDFITTNGLDRTITETDHDLTGLCVTIGSKSILKVKIMNLPK